MEERGFSQQHTGLCLAQKKQKKEKKHILFCVEIYVFLKRMLQISRHFQWSALTDNQSAQDFAPVYCCYFIT